MKAKKTIEWLLGILIIISLSVNVFLLHSNNSLRAKIEVFEKQKQLEKENQELLLKELKERSDKEQKRREKEAKELIERSSSLVRSSHSLFASHSNSNVKRHVTNKVSRTTLTNKEDERREFWDHVRRKSMMIKAIEEKSLRE